MPVPKGVDPKKFKRLEEQLAREGDTKNPYALATHILKRKKRGRTK